MISSGDGKFIGSKDTIEFLGLWEQLHNSNFKGVEFDTFKNRAGSNAFTMSPSKWIENTGAIGMVSLILLWQRVKCDMLVLVRKSQQYIDIYVILYERSVQ